MPIKKQEFYEGAALHLLLRNGSAACLRYAPPFFVINEDLAILLKYSTKVRSPWGFTFAPDEQGNLRTRSLRNSVTIGLICGADGVVALPLGDYLAIAALRPASVHIACYRKRAEYYIVSGPDGVLARKVSPSSWQRLAVGQGGGNEPSRSSP